MFPLKRISVFFFLSLILYGVLAMPWLGLQGAYRAGFCKVGNIVFRFIPIAGNSSAYFQANPELEGEKDVTIWMQKLRGRRVRGALDINSALTGYRALIFLVAMVVATPIAWKRRVWALVWGMLLVNAFVTLRVWLKLYDAFSNPGPAYFFKMGESTKELLHWCTLILFQAPEMNFIVPAFIWLLVSFRRNDLALLLGQTPAGEKSRESRPSEKRVRR